MTFLETCLYRLCLLISMCCTSYMIYLQFKYYLTNEDMASISHRIFNEEQRDEYPSIAICFYGYNGEIFNQSHDVFNSNNVMPKSYFYYLSGIDMEYPAQFTTIEFDDVVLDIHEGFLMNFDEFLVPYERVQLDLIPTFRSPRETCVSKNIAYRKNVKQKFDSITLNASMLY